MSSLRKKQQWKTLIDKHNRGVDKYVPKLRHKVKYVKEWFNKKCEVAKKKRDKAWNRWRRAKHPRKWQEYIAERNSYVNIHREEKKNYEKDIIDKCKDQPKLFYRYVNRKLKSKHTIEKLCQNYVKYTEDLKMAEIMNEHSQEFSPEKVSGMERRNRYQIHRH